MKRPAVNLSHTKTDKILLDLSLLSILFLWGYTAYRFQELPAKFATHYNASGEIDRMGNKNEIWNISVIETAILMFLRRIINQKQALQHHRIGAEFILMMSLSLILVFTYLNY